MNNQIRSIVVTVGVVLAGGVGVTSALSSLGGDPVINVATTTIAPGMASPTSTADASVQAQSDVGGVRTPAEGTLGASGSNGVGATAASSLTPAATPSMPPAGSIGGGIGDDDDDDHDDDDHDDDDHDDDDHDDDDDDHDDDDHDDDDHDEEDDD
ncbi:MAG: hypothetical protein ACKOJ9_10470 [Actinomycetota bacterium]